MKEVNGNVCPVECDDAICTIRLGPICNGKDAIILLSSIELKLMIFMSATDESHSKVKQVPDESEPG